MSDGLTRPRATADQRTAQQTLRAAFLRQFVARVFAYRYPGPDSAAIGAAMRRRYGTDASTTRPSS